MEQAPPKLPHLPVRHFFPGLRVRAAQDFTDIPGRDVRSGDLLKLLSSERTDDGVFILNLLVRTVRLSPSAPGHDAVIENSGNAWLQPVPSIACLADLCDAIDLELSEQDDDLSDADFDRLDTITTEVEACREWLDRSGERGPAPECVSGRLAARAFGRDHQLTAWIPLLFAGVRVASL